MKQYFLVITDPYYQWEKYDFNDVRLACDEYMDVESVVELSENMAYQIQQALDKPSNDEQD